MRLTPRSLPNPLVTSNRQVFSAGAWTISVRRRGAVWRRAKGGGGRARCTIDCQGHGALGRDPGGTSAAASVLPGPHHGGSKARAVSKERFRTFWAYRHLGGAKTFFTRWYWRR